MGRGGDAPAVPVDARHAAPPDRRRRVRDRGRDAATRRSRRTRSSTLIAHARTGLPGITAHTWLQANPLPDDLRAIPLVAPVIEHTIGLVTATTIERTPVITELFGLFEPLELDGAGPVSGRT